MRERATTGIRPSASSDPKKPAAATGIHGTPVAELCVIPAVTRDHRASGTPAAEEDGPAPGGQRRARSAETRSHRPAVQRTYDHFCLTARSLERVGDRWSLVVIRDLLTGYLSHAQEELTLLSGRSSGLREWPRASRIR